MRKPVSLIILLFSSFMASGQSPQELISKVFLAQRAISTIQYTLERADTFVTGTTRVGRGEVKLKSLPADTVLGFAFWAKKDGFDAETIYDGRAAFNIDHSKKSYESTSSAMGINAYLGNPGGQVVMNEIIKLDTANATGFTLKQDTDYYYLTMRLRDIKEYDVTNRSTVYTIDKKLLIPVQVRKHQETLGKVQDLNYRVLRLRVNDPATAYDFSGERFPPDYTRQQRTANTKLLSLKDQPAPGFSLISFTANPVSSGQFADKVVLLDFWEVWCGPCIASMPKVQALAEKYKAQGLEVYGMMSEKDQLEVAKLLVEKRKISFPMLVSNQEVMKQYGVVAVPTYILIDKKGNIRFTSEGFSDEMENEIKKLL